jgi:hypothetical protein
VCFLAHPESPERSQLDRQRVCPHENDAERFLSIITTSFQKFFFFSEGNKRRRNWRSPLCHLEMKNGERQFLLLLFPSLKKKEKLALTIVSPRNEKWQLKARKINMRERKRQQKVKQKNRKKMTTRVH